MFELMTPYNRVVVPHRECKLKLIGARDINTLEEVLSEFVAIYHGFDEAKSFSLRTISDCLNAACKLNPMESEGYVVVDANWNRIKVKCPQYVALSRLKESMSPRHMLDLVRKNEGDEFLSYFPEMRPLYEGIKAEFDRLCDGVDADYRTLQHIPEQKAFAIEAVKTKCSGALFAMRGAKAKNAKEYFSNVTIQNLERMMPPLPGIESMAQAIGA